MEKTYLDICITRCPFCNSWYAEVSWYALELECDLQCKTCGQSFSAKKFATHRVMLEFQLDKNGKIKKVKVA